MKPEDLPPYDQVIANVSAAARKLAALLGQAEAELHTAKDWLRSPWNPASPALSEAQNAQRLDFYQWAGQIEGPLAAVSEKAAAAPVLPGQEPDGLLRWCGWPECKDSYPAYPGPSVTGWKRSTVGVLLCPVHSSTEHQVKISHAADPFYYLFECGCGETSTDSATSLGHIVAWWRGHVRQLAAQPAPAVV